MTPSEFTPSWWLPGPHAQTIGGRLLRSARGVRLRRERLELPDGDFVDLDWDADEPGFGSAPLVLVLHGLEGSARSRYMLEMYRALRRRGLAPVGLNFRSCSGTPNRLPRMYHSGDTGDVAFVLQTLRDRSPARPLAAVGFSLGGNVLLKYLGESPRPTVQAAAAISVPFDLAAGADHLERGASRMYVRYLLRKLRRKLRAKAAQVAPRIDLARATRARTFREFDDLATARLHGFANAADYYRRSSSGPLLQGIRAPTLIVHAEDDPFLPRSAMPRAADLRSNPCLTVRFTLRGGHVGFVAGPPWAPVFWAEATAARFLATQLVGVPTPDLPSR